MERQQLANRSWYVPGQGRVLLVGDVEISVLPSIGQEFLEPLFPLRWLDGPELKFEIDRLEGFHALGRQKLALGEIRMDGLARTIVLAGFGLDHLLLLGAVDTPNVHHKTRQIRLLRGGHPRVSILLVKGLQLGKELVPAGIGIKGKGRCRQDGSILVAKVTAAKACLDLQAIAVGNGTLFLAIGGPVGLVANGCLWILVVSMAVISLGPESLTSLNDTDSPLVFGRSRSDGRLAVLEMP